MVETLRKKLQEYGSSMRCLYCESVGQLVATDDSMSCQKCAHRYSVEDLRPILLNGSSAAAFDEELSQRPGRAMVEEYSSQGASVDKQDWKRRIIGWLRPPELMLHYNPDLSRRQDTWELFTHQGSMTRILNVGGGPTRYSDRELTLNIRPFHNVDLVGDAHNIPFADDSFDSVICVAVLEHVHSPEKVVAEMIRVLKPGGKLYAEIPFIFFFHGYPNDFKRYTREGIKYLFRDLGATAVGPTQGPVSASLQTVAATIGILTPTKNVLVRKLVNGAFRWLFFWLKYIDLTLKNNDDAHVVAGGFWVLGSKKTTEAELDD